MYPMSPSQKRIRGSVATIAECLHNYWIRHAAGGPVEETVGLASEAIQVASEVLCRVPKSQQSATTDGDPQATTALIWLNALLFQMLLAQNLDTRKCPDRHRDAQIPMPDSSCSPYALSKQWGRDPPNQLVANLPCCPRDAGHDAHVVGSERPAGTVSGCY